MKKSRENADSGAARADVPKLSGTQVARSGSRERPGTGAAQAGMSTPTGRAPVVEVLIRGAPSVGIHGGSAASEAPIRVAPPVVEVAEILVRHYGTWPDESAGPVIDQLVWFLLSTRTTVENCDAAYAALRGGFSGWDEVAEVREEKLYGPLRPAGLYRARAKNLHAALSAIRERFGSASLEALRSWSDDECETFLLGLPGVGLKVARCVMSFGLGRPVLAVDTHIWRVTRRLGWHNFQGDAPSRRGADHLNALMPAGLDVLSLHVDLIRLGREFCPSGEPRCGECPLRAICTTAGTKASGARGDSDESPDRSYGFKKSRPGL